MATHSSILAWEIPWMEEPGGLQSIGSELDTTEQLHLHLKKKLHSEKKLYDHSSNLPNQK